MAARYHWAIFRLGSGGLFSFSGAAVPVLYSSEVLLLSTSTPKSVLLWRECNLGRGVITVKEFLKCKKTQGISDFDSG